MGEKGKNYHRKSRKHWREVKGDMLRKCGKMISPTRKLNCGQHLPAFACSMKIHFVTKRPC